MNHPTAHRWSIPIGDPHRYFVGSAISQCLRMATGVLLKVGGTGLNARFEIVQQLNVRIPLDVRRLLASASSGHLDATQLPGMASRFAAELHIINVDRLLRWSGIPSEKVTAIGQRDPIVWGSSDGGRQLARPIGDASLVAESHGVTVFDFFEQRDLAKGGSARGIDSVPLWLWLTKPVDSVSAKPTILARVDQSIELFYLPPRRKNRDIPLIKYEELGPGVCLWDGIKQRGLAGETSQSHHQSLMDSIQDWSQNATLESQSWRSQRQAGLINSLIDSLANDGAKVSREMLESVWADRILESLTKIADSQIASQQIVLTGRAARRTPFVGMLKKMLPKFQLSTEVDHRWVQNVDRASVAGILAALNVDQVAGNLPDISGASASRILGRVHPGSPSNWRNVLIQMEKASRQSVPLREAI